MYGSEDPAVALPILLDHVRAGRLDLTSLVGPVYPLDAVEEAVQASLARVARARARHSVGSSAASPSVASARQGSTRRRLRPPAGSCPYVRMRETKLSRLSSGSSPSASGVDARSVALLLLGAPAVCPRRALGLLVCLGLRGLLGTATLQLGGSRSLRLLAHPSQLLVGCPLALLVGSRSRIGRCGCDRDSLGATALLVDEPGLICVQRGSVALLSSAWRRLLLLGSASARPPRERRASSAASSRESAAASSAGGAPRPQPTPARPLPARGGSPRRAPPPRPPARPLPIRARRRGAGCEPRCRPVAPRAGAARPAGSCRCASSAGRPRTRSRADTCTERSRCGSAPGARPRARCSARRPDGARRTPSRSDPGRDPAYRRRRSPRRPDAREARSRPRTDRSGTRPRGSRRPHDR